MQPARHSCVFGLCPSARVDRKLSTSQQTLSVAIVDKHIKGTGSLIQQVRIYFVNPGRTVCLHSCGLPVVSLTRPTGAQVFALFPPGCEPSSFQHLVTAPDRPPRAQAVTGNGCPIARVDSCAVHFASDTGHEKQRFFFAFIPSESCHYVLARF